MKMKRVIGLFAIIVAGIYGTSWALFSSHGKVAFSAGVTVGDPGLNIQADPLPPEALFGTNLAIPVTITSVSNIDPKTLSIQIVYQLLDKNGAPINAPTGVPVQFFPGIITPTKLQGTAVVNRADLGSIQGGGSVTYAFQVLRNGSGTMLNSQGQSHTSFDLTKLLTLPSPFVTTIRDPWCQPVDSSGGHVGAPSLTANAGFTGVELAPNAVPSAGDLCIHAVDAATMPPGPGLTPPAVVYQITLENTSLAKPVQLVLNYPTDLNGSVLFPHADPSSLGMYWLDSAWLGGQWQPLTQAKLDPTLHTLTGMTGHFSFFALIPAGSIGAAELRPPQRIITPNGDGNNDTADFAGLGSSDEVKIFDVRGRRIRSIHGPNAVWDGADDAGAIVESGVYIYQYSVDGTRVSGVILVAK